MSVLATLFKYVDENQDRYIKVREYLFIPMNLKSSLVLWGSGELM